MNNLKFNYQPLLLIAFCLLFTSCKKERAPCMEEFALNNGSDENCLFLKDALVGTWEAGNWEMTIWEVNNYESRTEIDVPGTLTYTFKEDGTFEGQGFEAPFNGTWSVQDANDFTSIRKLILTYNVLGINHAVVNAINEQQSPPFPIGNNSPKIEEFTVNSWDSEGTFFFIQGQDFNSLNNSLVVDISMFLR